MRKTALATVIIFGLIVSLVFRVQVISLVEANPYIRFTASPNISLDSPLNKTYAGSVSLDFTVTESESWMNGDDTPYGAIQELLSVDYYIDGYLRGSIVANSNLSSPFHYSADLTDLQEGSHSLMVKTNSKGWEGSGLIPGGVISGPANSSSVTVHFNLTSTIAADTIIPPIISIISPINKTYENKVLLHLNVTAISDLQELNYVGYTLDDKNILIPDSIHYSREFNWSTTLEGLTEGTHTLKVFVSTRNYFNIPSSPARGSYQIHSGASDTITFTVSKPFSTTLIIGFVITVAAVVGLGLLVYLKKRQRNKSP